MTSLETLSGETVSPLEIAPRLSEKFFMNLFNHDKMEGEELEFTYSDYLAEDKSLPWEKVEKFILEDADFRTKKLPRDEPAAEE